MVHGVVVQITKEIDSGLFVLKTFLSLDNEFLSASNDTSMDFEVLSKYSNKKASTIHKKIYWIKTNKSGNTFITLKENNHTNTIFLVDEASMIPDVSDRGFGNRSLLDDLITYVYEGLNCKLILIGDTAQLPPVHLDVSPALDEENLYKKYQKKLCMPYHRPLPSCHEPSFN